MFPGITWHVKETYARSPFIVLPHQFSCCVDEFGHTWKCEFQVQSTGNRHVSLFTMNGGAGITQISQQHLLVSAACLARTNSNRNHRPHTAAAAPAVPAHKVAHRAKPLPHTFN